MTGHLKAITTAVAVAMAAAGVISCGGSPAPPAPPVADTPAATPPTAFVSIAPGPGTDSEILARMQAANMAADSAIQNKRPFLALVELEKLEQSGLPDTYRAMVWVNIGLVRGKIGALAAAKAAYDRAIELEKPLGRHYAMTLKAVFLAEQGFPDDSIAIFEELLARSDILPEERAAYTENIRVLKVAPRSVVLR